MTAPPRNRKKNPDEFTVERLMRLGQIAHREGDQREAHKYWKQAALKDPMNEQVWLSLLQILDNDADKLICLRNILTINPENSNAKGLYDALRVAMQQSDTLTPILRDQIVTVEEATQQLETEQLTDENFDREEAIESSRMILPLSEDKPFGEYVPANRPDYMKRSSLQRSPRLNPRLRMVIDALTVIFFVAIMIAIVIISMNWISSVIAG